MARGGAPNIKNTLYIIQLMNTWNTKKKKLATNVAKVGVIITSQGVRNRIVAQEAASMVVYAHPMVTDAFVLLDGMVIDASRILTNAVNKMVVALIIAAT